MNYESKEVFNNAIEANISEEEITLALPTELINEAKKIAESTKSDEKYSFVIQYDTNQKDFLLSLLQTAGVIVEYDDEANHALSTRMNMTQLAYIKRLNCIERVKSNEGIGANPFALGEMGEHKANVQNMQNVAVAKAETVLAIAEQPQQNGITVASVTNTMARSSYCPCPDDNASSSTCPGNNGSTSSCPCPGNHDLPSAETISVEQWVSGCICCPGAEQWFKFTAPKNKTYTIHTIGDLDTIGTLYDCYGNQIVEVDDYEPCGKINFRIIRTLTAGATYYIKVRVDGDTVGSYGLRITESVFANYTTISADTFELAEGVVYELPMTPNYTYTGYNGAQRIPGLSVAISPANTDEQKIWWYKSGNILNISYGWDDNGNRYAHATVTGSGTAKLYAVDWLENGKRDECTVYVGGAPVTGISLDRTTKTVSLNDTEQLTAIITPTNALNKGITWDSSNWNVVDVDSNGVITGLRVGTATISATTDEGEYIATCIVTVDKRPKVTIQKDEEYSYGDETYFNIIFSDGKVWQNVGRDLSLDENISGNLGYGYLEWDNLYKWEQRYVTNNQLIYSASQLAFAYLCDPYGVEYYLRHFDTIKHAKTLAELLWLRDEVFKEIFGCWPRLIKIFPDDSVSYYEYSRSLSDSTREDYLSDAEILFGDHPICDWLTFAELTIAGLNLVVTTLLSLTSETLGAFISAIDLTRYLFFNGAIEDVISSGESAILDLYVNDIINSSTTNKDVREGLSKRFGVVSTVVGAISTAINTGLFFPSADELSVCNKVNSEQLRASFVVDDEELSLQELIDCAVT